MFFLYYKTSLLFQDGGVNWGVWLSRIEHHLNFWNKMTLDFKYVNHYLKGFKLFFFWCKGTARVIKKLSLPNCRYQIVITKLSLPNWRYQKSARRQNVLCSLYLQILVLIPNDFFVITNLTYKKCYKIGKIYENKVLNRCKQ